ncbi:hypothetical protein PSECIP111951_00910 [Pseudoalteromonas holothuriae]|uniref:Uncharacterized protein n=1 Tax=Pseudoalteromonas holothuriae TaxID=2963714 RepID=A0A9W4QW32_9GAMM|nr:MULTISPECIES: hypothetical protein [unclassified Pseudoalteromonas]CAH9053868.1 hypothetical protein PSECIP111951_00910 [Pseudoalteromonas sp. CIP111951]CAH9055745.1 hypothetical protein PSECIP111854_01640 [Pseudoalteromonas sp. CIP111854]
MNNFVNVIQKLEELSARDSNQTQNINQLNSAIYKVRTDMKHHLDTQSTDLHRIEDIANVLGYKGRVQAKLSNFTPDTEDNTIMTLSNHSITDVVVDDRILIQEGEQQGIYQVKDQAGTLVIEQGDLKLISEDAVVVVKRFDGAGIVIEHIICQLSGGVWNERTLLA